MACPHSPAQTWLPLKHLHTHKTFHPRLTYTQIEFPVKIPVTSQCIPLPTSLLFGCDSCESPQLLSSLRNRTNKSHERRRNDFLSRSIISQFIAKNVTINKVTVKRRYARSRIRMKREEEINILFNGDHSSGGVLGPTHAPVHKLQLRCSCGSDMRKKMPAINCAAPHDTYIAPHTTCRPVHTWPHPGHITPWNKTQKK